MRQRSALEDFYTNALSDAERNFWDATMDLEPPMDGSFTSYVYHTPNRMNQVQVSRKTQFAWQWLYAVTYFAASPTHTPLADPDPFPQLTGYTFESDFLAVGLACPQDPARMWGILWYATPNASLSYANAQHAARIFARWTPDNFPRFMELSSPYTETWGALTLNPIWMAVFGVSTRGQLTGSQGYVQLTRTA
jgi:hypothetical protein